MAARLERGQVRLFRFNSPDHRRPVLLLTRGSAIRYLNKVTVAPISSTIRGVPSEVILDEADGMKRPCSINLHHLVSVPKKGFGARLAQISPSRLRQVCKAISFSLGCDE